LQKHNERVEFVMLL